MTLTRLLSTTAIAVLISGGIAAAQNTKGDEQPARAPSAQQHAPAEKVAPPMAQRQGKAPETTGQGVNAEHREGAGQTPDVKAGEKSEMKSGSKAEMKNGQSSEKRNKAEMQNGQSGEKSNKAEMKNNATQDNKAAATKSETHSTTGQGAAGAAKLSTEQRTKITTIFHQHKVAPAHLNVSISVGTRVPTSVHLYPVPVEVVDVYPEWRGFDYILVGDQIIVIDPGSHEIVAILEA